MGHCGQREQSRVIIAAALTSRIAGREMGTDAGSGAVYSPWMLMRGRNSGVSEQIRKSGSGGRVRAEGAGKGESSVYERGGRYLGADAGAQ